jgi:hypothetical protein
MVALASTSRRQLERQRVRQRRRIQLQRLQEQQEEQRRLWRELARQRRALATQRALEREKINEALFAVAMGKIPGEGALDDADTAARPSVMVLPNVFETRPPVVRTKSFTFADVMRRFVPDYRRLYEVTEQQDKLLREMLACYTPVLGVHEWKCADCGSSVQLPNGCNNRHCSTCGQAKRRRWAEKTCSQILPVKYCHLILTVPREMTQLAMQNAKLLYSLLLTVGAKTIKACGRKLFQVEMAMLSVLHTWGQLLNPHLHSHSLVPLGGLRVGALEWVSLSVKQMETLLEEVEHELPKRLGKALRKAYAEDKLQFDGDPELQQLESPEAFERWISHLENMTWVTRCPEVWNRRQMGNGPDAIRKVVEYLANYANRVALSDARILDIEGDQVLLGYKDYRDGDQQKSVWVDGVEMIRDFLQHQLPYRMQHIRCYGWMARRAHNDKLEFLREHFAKDEQADPDEPAPEPLEEEEPTRCCRFCDGRMYEINSSRRPTVPEIMTLPHAAFQHAQAGIRVSLGQQLSEIQVQRPGDPATRAWATEVQRQINDLETLGFL